MDYETSTESSYNDLLHFWCILVKPTMTATGHAIVGAAIAAKISNPWIGIPLAIVSHFVCDKIPHWDPMTDKTKPMKLVIIQTVGDVLVGFALVWAIFISYLHAPNPVYTLIMSFAAQSPDWAEVPYSIFHYKAWPFYYNYKLQSWAHDVFFDSRLKAPWGIITQIIVLVCVIAAVLL